MLDTVVEGRGELVVSEGVAEGFTGPVPGGVSVGVVGTPEMTVVATVLGCGPTVVGLPSPPLPSPLPVAADGAHAISPTAPQMTRAAWRTLTERLGACEERLIGIFGAGTTSTVCGEPMSRHQSTSEPGATRFVDRRRGSPGCNTFLPQYELAGQDGRE